MKKLLCILFLVAFLISACGYQEAGEVSYIETVSIKETVSIQENISVMETVSFETVYENAELISVPALCQYPELPTGCEATSAAMVLQFWGEDITPAEFASGWLECSKDFYNYGGISYGPDPNEVFAGDPFSEYAYGCFSGAVAKAVNNNSRMCGAETIVGKSMSELCEEYVEAGVPLLVWATMSMMPSYEGAGWVTPDGDLFVWPAREHCLVLVGCDDSFYYFNDPQNGAVVAFQKVLSEKRFAELGCQAVHIYKE